MSPSIRGENGREAESGEAWQASGLRARRRDGSGHGSLEGASKARARIEDGKDCKVANRVLHSMDRAIEERIENGIGRAGAKIVPREI